MSRNEWVTPRCGPHYRNKDIQHKMMADSIRPRNRQGSRFTTWSRRPTSCGSQRQEVKGATTHISSPLPPHYES